MEMKKKLRVVIILSISLICSLSMHYYSYGVLVYNQRLDEKQVFEIENIKVAIDTKITSDKFLEQYDPHKSVTGKVEKITSPVTTFITTIVNKILGILQQIGGLLSIVSVAMFGFALIVSGNGRLAGDLNLNIGGKPQGKKELLDFSRSFLIGSVLLFSSATLVRVVFSIFNIS